MKFIFQVYFFCCLRFILCHSKFLTIPYAMAYQQDHRHEQKQFITLHTCCFYFHSYIHFIHSFIHLFSHSSIRFVKCFCTKNSILIANTKHTWYGFIDRFWFYCSSNSRTIHFKINWDDCRLFILRLEWALIVTIYVYDNKSKFNNAYVTYFKVLFVVVEPSPYAGDTVEWVPTYVDAVAVCKARE